jgi:hypothetical protein
MPSHEPRVLSVTLFVLFSLLSLVGALSRPSLIAKLDSLPMHLQSTPLADITLLPHSISAKNAEARRFFDQGLTLVYAFNFDEAVRSFEHAAQLDPEAPMPYWGIALANSPTYNSGTYNSLAREKVAFDAIQKAKEFAAKAPENERAYVDALALRFMDAPNPNWQKLSKDYSAAMRELRHRYPDDPDASVLYAESLMDFHPYHLWTYDGQPGENTLEIASVLEGVLQRWPDHLGANHFYIHTMEASPYPERALSSAHRLETLAPTLGHLVHMPAHIYFRTGDYAAAEKSSLAAASADRTYLREKTIPNDAYKAAYAEHNFYFLIASANMDGDFPVASQTATELQSMVRSALAERPEAEPYLATSLFVLLRFARWDDILALPPPEQNLLGLTFNWHYARACSFASKKKMQEAQAERDTIERLYGQLPANQHFGMLGSWALLHELAIQTLDARIAAAQGDMVSAINHWRLAVAEQDKSERAEFYRELAAWYYPVRESLGAALLRTGQLPAAEQVFREDLRHNPKNPRSLFGLWKVLEGRESDDEANELRIELQYSWKGTTKDLQIENF